MAAEKDWYEEGAIEDIAHVINKRLAAVDELLGGAIATPEEIQERLSSGDDPAEVGEWLASVLSRKGRVRTYELARTRKSRRHRAKGG